VGGFDLETDYNLIYSFHLYLSHNYFSIGIMFGNRC